MLISDIIGIYILLGIIINYNILYIEKFVYNLNKNWSIKLICDYLVVSPGTVKIKCPFKKFKCTYQQK